MMTRKEFLEQLGHSLSTMKEADIMAKMGDSFDSLRCAVSSAINSNINNGVDMDCDDDGPFDVGMYAWVADLFPKMVVYSMGSAYFQCTWKRDASGNITLGKPSPVEKAWISSDAAVEESDKSRTVAVVGVGSREAIRNIQLIEAGAKYDSTKGVLTVKVIQPGFNKSKERFYPAETLKRDFNVFKGAKMFADHQTESEQSQRPEGSVNNWVASLNNVWAEADGTIMGEAVVIDPPFKLKLDTLNQNNLLTQMGVSIRAIGEASVKDIEGTKTKYVESFLAARSVDFVTYAGAGGQVMTIESSSLADENDVDLINESAFRTRRPDIVKTIESNFKEKEMKTLEQQLQESTDQLNAATAKIAALEAAGRKKDAAVQLATMISESKLPEVSAKRIQKVFATAENVEGMKEAIAEELEYVKSFGTPAIKKNNGSAENGNNDASIESENKDKKPNLVESFRALGLSEAEAKIAADI
jgi:hypothetical protein